MNGRWCAAAAVLLLLAGCRAVEDGGGSGDGSLGEVRIRVEDEETGSEVQGVRLRWHPWHEDECLPRSREAASEGGEFVIRTEPGFLFVGASAPWYADWDTEEEAVAAWRAAEEAAFPGEPPPPSAPGFEVRAGETVRRTVRLVRAGTLRILLREDGAPAAPGHLRMDVQHQTRDWGFLISGRFADGTSVHEGLRPGRYRLRVDAGEDGFAPVPDREVEVRARETTEVVVDLVRRR